MTLYNYYQKLHKLAQEQKKAIEDSNFDQLLKVLSQKQEIIHEIDNIDLEQYIQGHEYPTKVYAELKELIQNINILEEENQKNLKEKKSQEGIKMKNFNIKRKGTRGYQISNNYEAKFIDKKS